MENEKEILEVSEVTKKRGRPKKEAIGDETKILELENIVKSLSEKLNALASPQAGKNEAPDIYALDPVLQREREREKVQSQRKTYEKKKEWIEVKPGGKKVKITQIYYEYPDGTREQGNRYSLYMGRATAKEQTKKLEDL